MEERKIGRRENVKMSEREGGGNCLNHRLRNLCRARVGVGAGRTEFCADRGQDRE